MESPVAATAGPCVYVPISHPDSSVPTYAVLQVLGISSAPDPPLLPPYPALSKPSSAESGHSSSSSSSGERDRRLTALRPTPMKKSGSGSCLAPSALSPASARRPAKPIPPFKPIISITHTDKDTVIQASPSDFRKVVHQLTGAASGEKGLMPITTTVRPGPPPPPNHGGAEFASPASTAQVSASQCLAAENGDGGSANIQSGCGEKPAGESTANLLQRRKSSKVLGRLSTSCRNLPPLMPSPVTPLASDFEKIGLPATPSSSEGSLTPGIGSVASLSPLSHGTKAMQTLSLSGGTGGSHSHHGNTPTLSRSHKNASMQAKFCPVDVMDMQPPETSQSSQLQPRSLGFHTTEDVQLASSLRPQNRKISSRLVPRDADVLRLGLAPATGAVSLPIAANVQSEEDLGTRGDADAMDIETPGDGAGVYDSSSAVRESCSADEEDLIISQKGFFFHSERPQHRDLTLLTLFPESSREL